MEMTLMRETNDETLMSYLIENEYVRFDGENNRIQFTGADTGIDLTEQQSRLLWLLLTGTTGKQEIIRYVWSDNHTAITDNNYHQLIYQCRALFRRHGVPDGVIKTLPRHGVKFSYYPLSQQAFIDSGPVPTVKKTAYLRGLCLFMMKFKRHISTGVFLISGIIFWLTGE